VTGPNRVVVVGAGAAGVAAALSAARRGAQVTLVESQGFVGGNSAVLPWLGFHSREYQRVVGGLALELADALRAAGAGSEDVLDPVCGSAFSLNGHVFKALAIQRLTEAGVRVDLHGQVVEVGLVGDRLKSVVVQHHSGRTRLGADVFIDASGDGELSALAGATWEKGGGDGLVQAPSLVFRVSGIDRARFVAYLQDPESRFRDLLEGSPDAYAKLIARLPEQEVVILGGLAGVLSRAREAGRIDVPATRVVGVKTHVRDEFVAVTTKIARFDPLDAASLSDAYAVGYGQVCQLMEAFRAGIPGFEQGRLAEIAPMLGVRESRRIMADYVLTGDDVVEGRTFEDGVGMGAYHIDIHRPDGTWVDSHGVRPYDLPARALRVSGLENLLVAGKCFSATHEAIASTRVIPVCMAQGEAAGAMAAMSPGGDVRAIHLPSLQASLMDAGAILRPRLAPPDPAVMERVGVIGR